jgi:hypothetical protein
MEDSEYEGGVFTQERPVQVKKIPVQIGISPDGIPFFVNKFGEIEKPGKRKKKKRKRKRKRSGKVEGNFD